MQENNTKNSFQEIFEVEAPQDLSERSFRNTQGSVGTVKSFFEVLDLYISKFLDTLMNSFSASSSSSATTLGLGVGVAEEDEDTIAPTAGSDNNIPPSNS